MVIHDMRNPTNSIEFAVKEVLRIMFQAINNDSERVPEEERPSIPELNSD